MTRLLIVTPRYWPLVDDTACVAATLADAFSREGISTTILTAKWHMDWPEQVVHREAVVHRLPHPPRGGWLKFRYLRSLSRWLRQRADDFDLVYVMNLRQDAYATVGVAEGVGMPVVLRAQRAGAAGDCHWQATARFGRRIQRRCQAADVVVASTRFATHELHQAGYDSVRCIEDGVAQRAPRSPAERFRARQALADANYDLAVAEFAPVAVCVERFVEHRGIAELVTSWLSIAARWPSAKLWLIGDGPLREALHEGIVQRELHHHICMPGSFDDWTELLHAADVFVSPTPAFGTTQALLEAMAVGLPVVAMDTPDIREVIEPGREGLLIPPGERHRLSEAIDTLFELPERAVAIGAAARARIELTRPLARTVAAHLDLVQQLLEKPSLGK